MQTHKRLVRKAAERKRCDDLWSQGEYPSKSKDEDGRDDCSEKCTKKTG